MSTINLIAPFTRVIRPLFGFSLIAVLLSVFKPLLLGVFRVALLLLQPRATAVSSASQNYVRDTVKQNRLSSEYGLYHPTFAAELRGFASRDSAKD